MARKEIPKIEYGFRCEHCPVHKQYGAAKLTAEREAVKHSQRFYDHVVHILKTEIVYTLKREGMAYHKLTDGEAPF
jgi:hypothetical protein